MHKKCRVLSRKKYALVLLDLTKLSPIVLSTNIFQELFFFIQTQAGFSTTEATLGDIINTYIPSSILDDNVKL